MEPSEAALNNSVIFHHLIKFLEFDDLKSVRATCKAWNHMSQVTFLQRACVTFRNAGDMSRYVSSEIKAFTNFKLRCKFSNDREVTEAFHSFASHCGNRVTELQFLKGLPSTLSILQPFPNLAALTIDNSSCSTDDDDTLRCGEVLDDDPIAFVNENLRALEIIGRPVVPVSDDLDSLERVTDWNGLMKTFPNVEVLGAHCQSSFDLSLCLSALASGQDSWARVRDFSSALHEMEPANLDLLMLCGQKFTSLYFFIVQEPSALCKTELLLAKHHDTLQSLQLYYNQSLDFKDIRSRQPIFGQTQLETFPFFERVTSLNLLLDMVTSLNFLNWMPSLKRLDLQMVVGCDYAHVEHRDIYDAIIQNTRSDLAQRSVTSLYFEAYLAPKSVELIGTFFPCLKTLSVYVEDSGLQSVFRYLCHNLEQLIILGSGNVTDEGITGIPLRAFSRNYQYLQDYRSGSYIGNMTRLWRLRLPLPQRRLTDRCVTWGLKFAKNLRVIEVCETKITEGGKSSLRPDQSMVEILY